MRPHAHRCMDVRSMLGFMLGFMLGLERREMHKYTKFSIGDSPSEENLLVGGQKFFP